MATAFSAEPTRSPALAWATVVGGLAAALGWVMIGQHLGDSITLTNAAGAMAIYYLLLFAPLIALAIVLAKFGGQTAMRMGANPRRWLVLAAALGLGGLAINVGFSWVNGGLVRGSGGGIGAGLLIIGCALTLLQVFAEEILFRGWLQPALVARLGAAGGVALGAVLFAAFHLITGERAPLSLVNLALGGVWFGLLALRSGGILAPVAAHFAWNVLEDLFLGLTPNPGTGTLGAITDLDLMGSPWWGGTEEGLNASVGTTLVLVALIVPLLRGRPAKPVSAPA